MHPGSLSTAIHRLLASRLAGATAVLCLIFGGIAYYDGQKQLEAAVGELAQLRVSQFNLYIQNLLDAPEPLASSTVERELNNFVQATGEAVSRNGQFVLVRIYDQDGRQLLDSADEAFADIDAVTAAVDAAGYEAIAAGEVAVVTEWLEGLPFVGVALPLTSSANEVKGQIVGVFAVSEAAITELGGNIIETMLYVCGLIIATALVVYPILTSLLSRLSRTTEQLLDSNLEILQVLGGAIAKRDSDTDAHNFRVSVFSVRLAEVVGLSREEIRSLIKGALLHDVGKLGIRDHILLKPGKLNDEEFAVMKSHVEHGLEITDGASWLQDAQQVVGSHHEKYDGGGYPAGLSGESIPLGARIFAITDVFDALTSRRPYKEPMTFEETMEILESGRGSHFDPDLLDAFVSIARNLYDTYSGNGDDLPKRRLEELTQEYFRGKATDLLA